MTTFQMKTSVLKIKSPSPKAVKKVRKVAMTTFLAMKGPLLSLRKNKKAN